MARWIGCTAGNGDCMIDWYEQPSSENPLGTWWSEAAINEFWDPKLRARLKELPADSAERKEIEAKLERMYATGHLPREVIA